MINANVKTKLQELMTELSDLDSSIIQLNIELENTSDRLFNVEKQIADIVAAINAEGIIIENTDSVESEESTTTTEPTESTESTEPTNSAAEDLVKDPVVVDLMSKVKLTDVFVGGAFNRFIQYCIITRPKKGLSAIDTLDQLIGFDFDKILSTIPGIGSTSIERIKATYNESVIAIVNGTFMTPKDAAIAATPVAHELFNNIHEDLANLDLRLLKIWGIKDKQIELLNAEGYKTIGDLSRLSYNMVAYMFSRYVAQKIYDMSDQLNKSLYKIINEYMGSMVSNAGYDICLLRTKGKTLQEIADDPAYSMTRERIRQIQNSFIEDVSKLVCPIIDNSFGGNTTKAINVTIITKYIKDDNHKDVMQYCLEHMDDYEYIRPINSVIISIDGTTANKINNLILNTAGEEICITTQLTNVIKTLWAEGYTYMTKQGVINCLNDNGYITFNDYMFRTKPSYAVLCAKIISEKFPNGYKKDSDDIAFLRAYFKEIYGYDLTDSNRALETRLDDYLILCDRGKLTTPDHVDMDMDLLEKIKRYIDSMPETAIAYSSLFSKFEHELNQLTNVTNYHFLHGVLKYYYPYDYNYSSKDTFYKK